MKDVELYVIGQRGLESENSCECKSVQTIVRFTHQ